MIIIITIIIKVAFVRDRMRARELEREKGRREQTKNNKKGRKNTK